MEGAATTVYAQGGTGNARLVAWEGERTVTFTMEDALISPAGFMILSGAGLVDASKDTPIYVHATEQIELKTYNEQDLTGNFKQEGANIQIELGEAPAMPSKSEDYIYVMLLDERGEINTEPYIATSVAEDDKWIQIAPIAKGDREMAYETKDDADAHKIERFAEGAMVFVDYYVKKTSKAQQIDITPDKFGGNYYLEASTLFRNTDGVDMPAEFIIPNCKIQSNFTFTMASSGDPSTFTFTMDAFPDYTRFNKKKKVLAAIQIIEEGGADSELVRSQTVHLADDEAEIK